MEDNLKESKLLYQKGIDFYENNDFEEACKYFNKSLTLNYNEKTEKYVRKCNERINKQNRDNKFNNINNKTKNSTQAENQKQSDSHKEDHECQKWLSKKDFYDVLGLPKSATQEEIKRSYKKLAIKYHPDKNQSAKAEEAFKKVSQAYQTLSDPEKKKFYDQYGTEEEYREKYQKNFHQYNEEDFDPFDIFEMFFNGGNMNGNFQRRRRPAQQHRQQGNHRAENLNPLVQKYGALLQLLPILFILLIYVWPSLLQTTPLYQFYRSEYYNHKKTTTINKVEYYANDKFINKYPKIKDIKQSGIEREIEREYLNYIGEKCQNVMKKKQQLEYHLKYYQYGYNTRAIKHELDNWNYLPCYKYKELENKVK